MSPAPRPSPSRSTPKSQASETTRDQVWCAPSVGSPVFVRNLVSNPCKPLRGVGRWRSFSREPMPARLGVGDSQRHPFARLPSAKGAVGQRVRSVVRTLIVVALPAPSGPSNPNASARDPANDTPPTAASSPKRTTGLSTSTASSSRSVVTGAVSPPGPCTRPQVGLSTAAVPWRHGGGRPSAPALQRIGMDYRRRSGARPIAGRAPPLMLTPWPRC